MVTVLFDTADDAGVTEALLRDHDRDAGRLTIHPTPGTGGAQSLALDLLAALDRPYAGLGAQKVSGLRPVWVAVATWITADQVRQLTVLRANKLAVAAWRQLLQLQRDTGVRLVLVSHAANTVTVARRLTGVDYRSTGDVADVLAANSGATALAPSPPAKDAIEPLPPLPTSEFAWFRADIRRRFNDADFARIDAVYQHGMTLACQWAHRQPDRTGTITIHDDVTVGNLLYRLLPDTLTVPEGYAAAQLLESKLEGFRMRYFVQGLLCAGSDTPRRVNNPWPLRWANDTGMRAFLTDAVASCPSRQHTLATLRGIQAGLFLHGVYLELPGNLPYSPGPGMSTVLFTSDTAERIRRHIANPTIAAALAATMTTGLSRDTLARVDLDDLSGPADTITIANTVWNIPTPARAFLTAAREFQQLQARRADENRRTGRGPRYETSRYKRLLSGGFGPESRYLTNAARACEVPLPRPGHVNESWHLKTIAWHVGSALHNERKPS